MVWGLEMPLNFGQFFLDGGYVGWEEALTDHFLKVMSEEEQARYGIAMEYVYSVPQKFRQEFGEIGGERVKLDPPEPHECPREYAVKYNRAKSFGSLIELADRLLAVDATLKEVIESLEPGVHQFWPIKITMPQGEAYPASYYVMRIGRFLDSFSPEHSAPDCYDEDMGLFTVRLRDKKHIAGLAMSKKDIGSAHLWRERRLVKPSIYFSDALQADVEKAGLHLPTHYKLKDV